MADFGIPFWGDPLENVSTKRMCAVLGVGGGWGGGVGHNLQLHVSIATLFYLFRRVYVLLSRLFVYLFISVVCLFVFVCFHFN